MENNLTKEQRQYRRRLTIVLFADIFSIVLSYFLALLIRFDFLFNEVPEYYFRHLVIILPFIVVTYLVVYNVFHLYQSIWRYASVNEAYHIVYAYIVLAMAGVVEHLIFFTLRISLPRGVSFIGYVLSLFFCVAIRFGYRLGRYFVQKRKRAGEVEGMKDTPNKLIHIGHPIEMDDEKFLKQIRMLDRVSKSEAKPMVMKQAVSEVVRTYHPDLVHVDQAQGDKNAKVRIKTVV